MEKELGADIIKSTQTSLGKYVKRPPLSEKLLRKPPFRFLHDIVVAVYKTTGFFEGLFEEEELISENVKDRDSKLLFLNKVISVIGTTTGKPLAVKSSKIVAGQEPDKTNELLQCLALALDKKLSSDDAVRKYNESAKVSKPSTDIKTKEKDTSKTTKRSNDAKKLTSKSNEKLTATKKDLGTVNKSDTNTNYESKNKRKESILINNETQPKKPQQRKNKNTSVPVTNKVEPVADLIVNPNVIKNDKEEQNKKSENESVTVTSKTENLKLSYDQIVTTSAKEVIQSPDQEFQAKLNTSASGKNELNSSLSSQDLMEVENSGKSTRNVVEDNSEDIGYSKDQLNHKKDIFTDKENKTMQIKNIESILTRDDSNDSVDNSSELDKRKIIDQAASISSSRKNSDVCRPPSVRPSSSRPGAPRFREKIDNVLSDNVNLLLAKVNIIAENTNNEDEEDTSIIVVAQHTNDESMLDSQLDLQLSSNEHGHLVQQILDSQKVFSHVGKTEIEWQFGSQKVKEAVNQEIEQLRFSIQALSRVANPLGKLLDHMQEDAEVMRQELKQWTNVYDEVSKEMQKQKTANEETLVPLQARIKQLDADVQEKHDKIDDLKILIHKNASRIEKLLASGNVQ